MEIDEKSGASARTHPARYPPREMLRFGHNFIDGKCDAQDRIIPRETAILTIVDAFVRKIEGCKEAHGPPKILQCERAGSLRHGFKFFIRFQGNQMLKALDQLRFSQSKAVQCLDKRHQDSFVCTTSLANLPRTKKTGVRYSRRRYSKRSCGRLRTRR